MRQSVNRMRFGSRKKVTDDEFISHGCPEVPLSTEESIGMNAISVAADLQSTPEVGRGNGYRWPCTRKPKKYNNDWDLTTFRQDLFLSIERNNAGCWAN